MAIENDIYILNGYNKPGVTDENIITVINDSEWDETGKSGIKCICLGCGYSPVYDIFRANAIRIQFEEYDIAKIDYRALHTLRDKATEVMKHDSDADFPYIVADELKLDLDTYLREVGKPVFGYKAHLLHIVRSVLKICEEIMLFFRSEDLLVLCKG